MWKYILTWTVTFMISSLTDSGRKTTYNYLHNKVEYFNSDKVNKHFEEIKLQKSKNEFIVKNHFQNWVDPSYKVELEYVSRVKLDSVYVETE